MTKPLSCIALAITLMVSTATAMAQTITTIAGNGATGFLSGAFGGDGGPATAALLYYPGGMVYDAAGSLYLADSRNHRVRKIDAAGIITTFAGTGNSGYSGDGGPATAAEFGYPESLAIDGSGNLYVSDHWQACVRKISPAGIITTVAGTGVYGYSGDGGPATAATLDNPCHVQVDAAGNLYICDWVNARLRKVDPAGIITTIAGSGSAPHSGDGGPATGAGMRPTASLTDAAGNLLICDGFNRRIRKVDAAGNISTIAGIGGDGYSGDGGPASAATFRYISGMIADASGNLLLCDQGNNVIRRIDAAGNITTVAGTGSQGYSGDGGLPIAAQFRFPTMMAFDPAGKLLVSDLQNNRVRRLDVSAPATLVPSIATSAGNIRIHPNPTQETLYIDGLATPMTCTVTDISGRCMLRHDVDKASGTLSLGSLPQGIYTLRLAGPGGQSEAFLLQKE